LSLPLNFLIFVPQGFLTHFASLEVHLDAPVFTGTGVWNTMPEETTPQSLVTFCQRVKTGSSESHIHTSSFEPLSDCFIF